MGNKVSVVIPTYKRTGERLIKTIQSVLKQTYKNLEIIVVDDNGNPVYSKELVNALKLYPEIKYIAHKENKGACEARNTGILNSEGQFIAFLDDDDTWESNKIEKQLDKFNKPNIGLVYCGIKYYYEKNDKVEYKSAIKYDDPCRELLIHNYIGSTSCGIVRKNCAIAVGMFDKNLKSGQDLDFWYRIAEKYEVECVEECLLNYTIYTEDTITANINNRLESNLYLKEKYGSRIKHDTELITIYNLKILKAYLKLKQPIKAVKHIKKSIVERELSLKCALQSILK